MKDGNENLAFNWDAPVRIIVLQLLTIPAFPVTATAIICSTQAGLTYPVMQQENH